MTAPALHLNVSDTARVCGVSQPLVSAWVNDPDDPLPAVRDGRSKFIAIADLLHWYHRRQSAKAGVHVADQGEKTDLKEAQTQRALEDAERLRLQNAEKRGESIPLPHFKQALNQVVGVVAGQLDGILAQTERLAPRLSANDLRALEKAVAQARNGLQTIEYDPGA